MTILAGSLYLTAVTKWFSETLAAKVHVLRWGETMLHWTLMFLIIAVIAALLGFTGVAGAAAGIAKVLFFIFLVVWLIAFIGGRRSV
jgi:uncharacterized membrane protein YtjA (UPF0391 family)